MPFSFAKTNEVSLKFIAYKVATMFRNDKFEPKKFTPNLILMIFFGIWQRHKIAQLLM